MNHTVEDTLEILAGLIPRLINIRIDQSERNLIRSLAKQCHNNIALTDKQLELSLKKIAKYKTGLEQNSVDVDSVLNLKLLRMPLREIDRSHSITTGINPVSEKPALVVKFPYSKKISKIWDEVNEKIIGEYVKEKNVHYIAPSEHNLYLLVDRLKDQSFDIDEKIMEIYRNIEDILENPNKFVPYIDLVEDSIVLKNVSRHCREYFDKKFPKIDSSNILAAINELKNCGITHKNPEILKKISSVTDSEIVKKVLSSTETRFRLSPETHSVSDIAKIVDSLEQWPLLVILEGENTAYEQVTQAYEQLKGKISNKEMTVFFRLNKGQKNSEEFAQFVKDNGLNNYIDSSIKVVFITKTRIPKPLLKADWKPNSAILMSSHDYGKTAAYLNDFPTVYYFNDSLLHRNSKIKGSKAIVNL